MNRQITGILAYITFIGWLVAYLAGDRAGAKFHLNQALVLNLVSILVSTVTQVLQIIFRGSFLITIVSGLVGLGIVVLTIMGLVGAIQQTEKPVPVLGGIQILT